MYPHHQPVMTGIEYQMVNDYEPDDPERCIACQRNDLIFVQKPFCFPFMGSERRPEGWLHGKNTRTKDTGYIPAEYVTFVQEVPPRYAYRPPPPDPEGLAPLREEEDDPMEMSPPPLPKRIPNSSSSYTSTSVLPSSPEPVSNYTSHIPIGQSLQDQKWYWGNASREEAKAKLTDEPDGTFLVRNAANNNPNEFTLTLCKGGNIKLIRICCRNGMFGFAEPFVFTSVVQLVNNYKHEPLARHNPDLDVTLKYPASRHNDELPSETMDELWKSLRETDRQFILTSTQYQDIFNEFSTRQQDIYNNRTAISAYEETIRMFREQCATLSQYIEKARGSHDEARLFENFRLMQNKLVHLIGQSDALKNQLHAFVEDFRRLDEKLNVCKAEMMRIKKLRDDKIAFLKSRRIPEEIINQYLQSEDDGDNIYHLPEATDLRRKYPDHCVAENWYFASYDRAQADKALEDKINGTFLIRDRQSESAPYACSLVAHGTVHHCLIEKTEDGYGFAEPFNLHATLIDLVMHYAHNPLIPHNERLDTTLRVPLACSRRR